MVECSDVHRAAGAHITCVKNFSTYLWGPDEVEVMRAVGNRRGVELYGSATVRPSDSKQLKVDACTKKYGCAQAQRAIEGCTVVAKAETAGGPKPSAKPQSASAEATGRRSAPAIRPKDASGPQVAAPLDTDWFDSLFAPNEDRPPAAPMELDDFLTMCNSGSAPGAPTAKQGSAKLSGESDALIFQDFGSW